MDAVQQRAARILIEEVREATKMSIDRVFELAAHSDTSDWEQARQALIALGGALGALTSAVQSLTQVVEHLVRSHS